MSHGPECPLSDGPVPHIGRQACQCVTCHCGDLHQPGGEFNTCRRCLRKRTEDLHTWKAALRCTRCSVELHDDAHYDDDTFEPVCDDCCTWCATSPPLGGEVAPAVTPSAAGASSHTGIPHDVTRVAGGDGPGAVRPAPGPSSQTEQTPAAVATAPGS